MIIGQLVVSSEGSLHLIAAAMADIIKKSGKRTLFCQGLSNQYILTHFHINDRKNIRGYISKNAMTSCKENNGAYIYSDGIVSFIDNFSFRQMDIFQDDILLKGGNALYMENGEYKASVLSSSPDLGTYKNIYMKAIAASANVFIPISLDKYIAVEREPFVAHEDIKIFMGDFSAIKLPLFYGKIYTEIDAFKYLFKLDASLFAKGGSNGKSIEKIFLVNGDEINIKNAMSFLEKHN